MTLQTGNNAGKTELGLKGSWESDEDLIVTLPEINWVPGPIPTVQIDLTSLQQQQLALPFARSLYYLNASMDHVQLVFSSGQIIQLVPQMAFGPIHILQPNPIRFTFQPAPGSGTATDNGSVNLAFSNVDASLTPNFLIFGL